MRKLLNIAIVILIVAILLGAGAGGYLWYSTKQEVDRIATMAKPFADISYGGIDVSPTGSVGVNRLRIRPNLVNDSISIGAIRLNTPNFLALLDVRWQLSQNQLPKSLALSFQDFELSLSGGILGGDPAGRAQANSPFDHLDALGCGPITAFGVAEWREMGYDRFVGNMEIGYRVDSKNNVLELRMDSNMRDWATLNLEIDLALAKPPESLAELALSLTPKLAKLNFVLRDDGFNQRRNVYCAAKAGKPVPEYLADHVQRVAERLRASGVVLGPGLIAAYQRYLIEGGALAITAMPPAPIDPAEAVLGPAGRLVGVAVPRQPALHRGRRGYRAPPRHLLGRHLHGVTAHHRPRHRGPGRAAVVVVRRRPRHPVAPPAPGHPRGHVDHCRQRVVVPAVRGRCPTGRLARPRLTPG